MKRLRLALMVAPMLAFAGCVSFFGQATQNLGDRLQVQLTKDIAAGRVTLDRLPDGARVTLLEPALYPGGGSELDDTGRGVLNNVIEALLDPRLLRIEVAGSPPAAASVQAARVQGVTQYFKDADLGSALEPSAPPQGGTPDSAGTASQGLTITVTIKSS